MDRGQLEIELRNFCQSSSERGFPVIIDGLSEAYPGVANSSFTVHIRVEDWAGGMSCSTILDQVLPILFDTTSDDARRQIFSIDVYNAVDGLNCHHVETYTEFQLAC